ncbi:hypothetical protein [Nocardia gamkensis]|uniref:hypothetical protein n=1 Tax=Nocardia gamkensis TaxID=352869 RepID=UPI0037AEEF77
MNTRGDGQRRQENSIANRSHTGLPKSPSVPQQGRAPRRLPPSGGTPDAGPAGSRRTSCGANCSKSRRHAWQRLRGPAEPTTTGSAVAAKRSSGIPRRKSLRQWFSRFVTTFDPAARSQRSARKRPGNPDAYRAAGARAARWAYRRAPGTYAPDRGGLPDPARRAETRGGRCSRRAGGSRRHKPKPEPTWWPQQLREVLLDVEEGADLVMVEPAGLYLDVGRRVADAVDVPVAASQVQAPRPSGCFVSGMPKIMTCRWPS